jgi:hypothetical protein
MTKRLRNNENKRKVGRVLFSKSRALLRYRDSGDQHVSDLEHCVTTICPGHVKLPVSKLGGECALIQNSAFDRMTSQIHVPAAWSTIFEWVLQSTAGRSSEGSLYAGGWRETWISWWSGPYSLHYHSFFVDVTVTWRSFLFSLSVFHTSYSRT